MFHCRDTQLTADMKLFGIIVLVALVLVAPNDGRRQKRRRSTAIVEEVEKIKAKVEELTAKVQELQEQSRGVHIHIGDGHHDTEHHHTHDDDHHHTHDDDHHHTHDDDHHHTHDDDHHHTHDDDNDDDSEDDSKSTETSDGSDESTSTSDESDSSSSSDESDSTENSDDTQNANHHDNEHHNHSNEHSHNGHHHDHHHRHHPNAENIYVNMKLQGSGCHDDKHAKNHRKDEHEIHAHCEMMANMEIMDLAYKVRGHVKLTQKSGHDEISLDYNLWNLMPSHSHAVHIHESGDMERCCDSLGGHYNPHRTQHGLPSSGEAFDSHVGDLGNIAADDEGYHVSEQTMHADLLDMIGRSFVIHEGTDSGEGNQGRKLACCVIGRAHEDHQGNHDDHSHHSHDGDDEHQHGDDSNHENHHHGDHGHHKHHHHGDDEHDGEHGQGKHHHHENQS